MKNTYKIIKRHRYNIHQRIYIDEKNNIWIKMNKLKYFNE